MSMPCSNTAALTQHERDEYRKDLEWERKLAEFQLDPIAYIEWKAHRACPYTLAALALELLGREFGVDYHAPETTRQEFRDWLRETIAEIEI